MTVALRNAKAKTYVNDKIAAVASSTESDFVSLIDYSEIKYLLTDLIEVDVKGFRGVVLTAIVGLHLSPTYDPLNAFYDCNPRAIFEQGIWSALRENSIPCGKSDPLNVAKNINELNESWAAGKRPLKSALAAVKFLRHLTKTGAETNTLINYFFFRLVKFSHSISSLSLTVAATVEISNREIADKLVNFIHHHPESGQTPQFLISRLLSAIYTTEKICVMGGNESVFGTNTTSKKPADIWTELDGTPLNLYEITVKKIDYKRLDDCIDALAATGNLDKPVTFICRLPADTKELAINNGTLTYKNKKFDFVDIYMFIISLIAILDSGRLSQLLDDMRGFISDINISTNTKLGWNSIFEKA